MEDLQKYLGSWGRYQTRVYLLFVLPIASLGPVFMLPVLIQHIPQHRCRMSGWAGDTYRLQSEEHREAVNRTIPLEGGHSPSYSHCATRNTSTAGNSSQHLAACHAWVYDTSEVDTSLISQFDLVCDRKTYRAHLNMAMLAGVLVGALVSGYLCDWCGRKVVFYVSTIVCMLVGIAAAFPPNIEVTLIYRFLTGCLGSAMYMAAFVLLVELVGPERRAMAASMLTITWLVGVFLLAAVSYLVREWHYLQIISSAPLALCIGHWWLLPESPRWLLIKKKQKEALEVIQKVARVNKIPLTPSLDTLEKLQQAHGTEGTAKEIFRNMIQMFKHPRLAVVTVIIFFNWFVVSMTYYGLALNVGNLGGSLRVNFFVSTVVELVGYSLAWVLLDRLGRKRSHCAFILTAGLACLATIVTVSVGGESMQWMTTALAMVGKLGVSASFTAVYLISAEIFPTVIRNMGVSCCSAWGRLGSVISPYIADIALHIGGEFGRAVPLVIFGGLAVVAGISALYLPETLHRTLPDTVEDAVNFVKNCHGKKDRTAAAGGSDTEEEEKVHDSLLTQTSSAL